MSTRRSSINDVAKAAGVAIKTVSRVLNNEPNVREETSAKVLAARTCCCRHSKGRRQNRCDCRTS